MRPARRRRALPRALLTTALASTTGLALALGTPLPDHPWTTLVRVAEDTPEAPGHAGGPEAQHRSSPVCPPGTQAPADSAAATAHEQTGGPDHDEDATPGTAVMTSPSAAGAEAPNPGCVPPAVPPVPVPAPPGGRDAPASTGPGPVGTPGPTGPVGPGGPDVAPDPPSGSTPAPGTAAPEDTVPGSTVPGSTVPGSTVPGSTVPGSTVPGSTVPDSGIVPGSGVPGSSTVPGNGPPAGGAASDAGPPAVPDLTATAPDAPATDRDSAPAASRTPTVLVGEQMYFLSDFDDGLVDWGTCQTPAVNGDCARHGDGKNIQVIEHGGPDGGAFARFTVRDGDSVDYGGERAEVRDDNAGATVHEGNERWYEWSMRVAEDLPKPSGRWFIVLQWHAGDGSPPLAIDLSKGSVDIGGDGVGAPRHTIGPLRRGQWVRYVLHVRFSRTSGKGFVEAWENGVQTVTRTSRATMTSKENYLKQGIYRDTSSRGTAQIDFDGLRVTGPRNQGEVQPKLRDALRHVLPDLARPVVDGVLSAVGL